MWVPRPPFPELISRPMELGSPAINNYRKFIDAGRDAGQIYKRYPFLTRRKWEQPWMIERASILVWYGGLVVGLALCLPRLVNAVTLSRSTLDFGKSPQALFLTNRSGSTLHLGQITIGGANPRDFSMTTNCGRALAAGADCQVSVSFLPTAMGERSASLLFSDDVGGPQRVSLTGAGQFISLSADRTHLVNTFTNQPVFITGDTAYALAVELSSDKDIEAYLSDRQAKGINLIWVGLADATNHGEGSHNVGHTQNDAFGNNPWNGGLDFTGMESATAYWNHVDEVIQRAAAHGITVLAGTAFTGAFDSCNFPYYGSMAKTSDATMTAYGAFLGNRYKSYPNIIWLQGGDANVDRCGSDLAKKVDDIARGIRSMDSRHLMTVEATSGIWGEASATNWSAYTYGNSHPQGWITLGTIYPKGTPDKVLSAEIAQIIAQNITETEAAPFIPYFSIEDPYEYEPWSNPYSREQLRQVGYVEVLSGAHLGRMFGSSGVWPFGAGCCQQGSTWQENMEHPASFDQQRLGRLFRSREHWKLVADLKHEVVTAGYGAGAALTVTSRTSDGQTIIAYLPNGNTATVTVDMTKITSPLGRAVCWWFNPSSGDATLIGSYANSGTRDFVPPDSKDWVLVIDDVSANLPAPGSP